MRKFIIIIVPIVLSVSTAVADGGKDAVVVLE